MSKEIVIALTYDDQKYGVTYDADLIPDGDEAKIVLAKHFGDVIERTLRQAFGLDIYDEDVL